MNGSIQGAGFAFAVGGSQSANVTVGSLARWELPPPNAIIKHENKVLIWRREISGNQIIKLYRHRGALNRLRGRLLPFRVQREFSALNVLVDGGVPCSAPLLWGWGASPEHGQFELLATREIPDAISLKQHFSANDRKLSSEDWLRLFDTLRLMHQRGIYHGALWPKNILLTRTADDACQFHIIDLARAVRFPSDIGGTSMARFDLLSLLYSLTRTDAPFDPEAALTRYGWKATEAREIAEQARRYHSSRHLRNRLALTFQLRARFDWARKMKKL